MANRKASSLTTDIAISGAGLTGALAAIVLKQRHPHFDVTLMDDGGAARPDDPRGIALAYRTFQLLEQTNVWTDVLTQASQPIEHIHVSEQGGMASCELHAQSAGVDALGRVVMAGALQQALLAACGQLNIKRVSSTIDAVGTTGSMRQLTMNDGSVVDTRLLVVAEGSHSSTREKLGIGVLENEYPQVAIAGMVTHRKSHNYWAFERFTTHGPAALLPQQPRKSALVWCVSKERANQLSQLTPEFFAREVQDTFPLKAGRIDRATYAGQFPLKMMLADRYIGSRSVLIGNACHTLHPVAGQGYNLGVRDILALAQHLNMTDPGDSDALAHYAQQREGDYRQISGVTDGLVRTFSNNSAVLKIPRQIGLMALRTCPLFGAPLVRKAMGFRSVI